MGRRDVTVSMISADDAPEEVRLYFMNHPGGVFRFGGFLYLQAGEEVLRCGDDADGNAFSALLARGGSLSPGDGAFRKDDWFRLLTLSDPDQGLELARRMGIDPLKSRTVIVFRMKHARAAEIFEDFREMTPMEKEDHLVLIGEDSIALVKATGVSSEEEIAEFAAAVIDTMISEGLPALQAGIGTAARTVAELPGSLEEARKALLTGVRYDENGTLYRYSTQRLERIVDMIPAEGREKILREFYSNAEAETFNDEMLETIRAFFDHDLNITSASRELFIHRNTLNYRLDKIRRETGLDLRTFRDAAVFRLISTMKKRS